MEINVCDKAGVTVIKLSGEIIGPASREFRDVIAKQLAGASATPKLLFNFADVSIMDSTALGVLMGTHQTIGLESGRMSLIHLSSKLEMLIAKAKLVTVFEQFGSEDEAITALTSG